MSGNELVYSRTLATVLYDYQLVKLLKQAGDPITEDMEPIDSKLIKELNKHP